MKNQNLALLIVGLILSLMCVIGIALWTGLIILFWNYVVAGIWTDVGLINFWQGLVIALIIFFIRNIFKKDK